MNNILEVLSKSITKHDFITNVDVFTHKIIKDSHFKPFGTLIKKYTLKCELNNNKGKKKPSTENRHFMCNY